MLEAPVRGVEFIDRIAGRPGEADIGLVLREDDLDVQQRWKSAGPERLLEVHDA